MQRLSASEEEAPRSNAGRTTPRRVLNAFRHQRKNHSGSMPAEDRRDVLNAFRHQRKNHEHRGVSVAIDAIAVLNAFRHQRKNHSIVDVGVGNAPWLCSTPFGIRGRITSQCVALADAVAMCSTPFGIRGRITCDDRRSRARRCASAQRLSASEEESLVTAVASRRSVCRVLNAFRHQRKNHTECASGRCHSMASCSTPFGIRGRITHGRPCHCRRCMQVLNAFRHQRKNHRRCRSSDCRRACMCSTPFGIRGRITTWLRCFAR